ncbi:MAG: alpha/beta fold hydrolase [Planctomycetota bacterium]
MSAPASRKILLLHGALYTRHEFAPLIGTLDALGTPAHAIDLPGHGVDAATDPASFGIEAFASHVLAWLDAHDIAQADIFGYSMGGYVGLWLAHQHPTRVRRVFTLATKLDWTPDGARAEVAKLDADTIAAKVPRFAQTLAARHGDNGWRTLLQRTADMMLALGDHNLLADAYAGIACPVRLAVGDRDVMVSLAETADAMRRLPDGEMLVLPRTPHPLEKVPLPRLAAEIRDWLGS